MGLKRLKMLPTKRCATGSTILLIHITLSALLLVRILIRIWSPGFNPLFLRKCRWQLKEQTGRETPDYVVACVGGGSNAAGAFYHFLDDENVKLVAVEAAGHGLTSGHSAATTALGRPGVLHGSRTILMQTEDGQVTEPYSISAGLDYPGIGPQHAYLYDSGRGTFLSATDEEAVSGSI